MVSFTSTLLVAAASIVSAQVPVNGSDNFINAAFKAFEGDPLEKYTLTADGINATFIPYGARLTNLFVKDKSDCYQDIVLGYDNATDYILNNEGAHAYFGPIVGRYANRIKNGTFTLDGVTSNIPKNEHNGTNPLHGGFVGYDQQNWTVASVTGNSITFVFYDEAQSGFPGDVLNVATYTLTDAPSFISRLVSIPLNDQTPIMLANHIYWNLGAYVDQNASYVLDNTLYMPYADRIIDIDGIEIPTGGINLTNGTAYDFTKPKTIGQDIDTLVNSCGTGCSGYDNAFILDRPRYSGPDDPELEVLQLSSPVTGIKMSLESNQQGIQIYTCTGQNGTVPVKASQQHANGTQFVEKGGCIVIETQDWIDGISNPQWGRNQWQVFSPTTQPAINYQKYTFSVLDD